jgi:hypothetical protein
MTLDHCRRNQLRIRAAGQGVLPDHFYAGNWINRVHQLTSINIAPNVFSNFGYDLQYCPKVGPGCRHKGRVRFISEDNGATPRRTTLAVYLAATVCASHPSGYNCPAVLTNQAGWTGSQQPGGLYFGNGHAPYLTGLSWPVDQHSEAKAHGTLHTYKSACLQTGSRTCRQYRIRASLVFSRTKFHCGPKVQGHCADGYFYSVLKASYPGTGFNMPRRMAVSKRGYWR